MSVLPDLKIVFLSFKTFGNATIYQRGQILKYQKILGNVVS